MRPVVVTGVTGFIGRHVASALLARGVAVRGLTRSRSRVLVPVPDGVDLIEGDIASPRVAEELTSGAAVVVHCAGAIKARSRREFYATNGLGTERIVEAAERSGVDRLVHVSSIAAREPHLSDYAASKRQGEAAVERKARNLSWVIVRPPAVYGPGDRATLPLLRALSQPTAWLPGTADARFSLIHVTDLAHALAILATSLSPGGQRYEIDDGSPGGHGWSDIEAAASQANGRPTRIILVPRSVLLIPALAASWSARLASRAPLVSVGKLNELYHPDWVARGPRLEEASPWRPEHGLSAGLGETLAWYRRQGWLPRRGSGRDDALPRARLARS